MRTRNWLLAASVAAIPAAFLVACGDSGSGSGGAGGTGTSSNSSSNVTTGKTSGVVTSSTATTGSATTSVSSSTSGSTTNSSSSVSTGSGGPGADNCPGDPSIALAVGQSLALPGSTGAPATNDFAPFCGANGSMAPDWVYHFTTAAECTFKATLAESGFDGLLELRSSCATRDPGTVCFNQATHGETLKSDLLAGDHWLVVDGNATADAGGFALTLDCQVPVCGDGVLNAGEQCDDTGPTCVGCQIVETTGADTCAMTQAIPISMGSHTLPMPPLGAFSNGPPANDDYNPIPSASCPFVKAVLNAQPPQSAPDEVFDLRPTTSGTMTITIGHDADGVTNACAGPDSGCWNSGMFVEAGTCSVATAPIACDVANFDVNGNGGVYTLTFPVTANTDYFVFVKSPDAVDTGAGFNYGTFYLQVTL